MSDRLIIFTHYPEPGKAKTRLIPALGAEAAADLHRQMTEWTLAQVRLLQQSYLLTIEVWFAGSDLAFSAWFRNRWGLLLDWTTVVCAELI